ncbi:unnamed protein product [Camellia sinensis]
MCHYVEICGYDAMTDEFEIRDPASSGKHEKVTSKRPEEARKSFGTDEDLLLLPCDGVKMNEANYDGNRFITIQDGVWKATLLLLAVAVVELS